YNYVDHVMDNYSLRQPEGAMALPSAMNPDRQTTGAKLALALMPTTQLQLDVGIDLQRNEHSSRSTMNQVAQPYTSLERIPDARFEQAGAFVEADWGLDNGGRIVAGARADLWRYRDQRQEIALGMMSSVANPPANFEREATLHSGFVRYALPPAGGNTTWFGGGGHNEPLPASR